MRAFFIRVLMALVVAAGLGGAALAKPLPVKVVIVTTFEIGADTGDFAGEFQPWVEGWPLTHEIKIPGVRHVARYSDDGVLAIVSDMRGRARESVAALILSDQFDLTHAYWIVSGIAGVDPKSASIGSAAWARYVVDADPIYEVDERDMPAGWPYGLYSNDAERPNVKGKAEGSSAMVWTLDRGLVDWAYALTRDVKLPDSPALQALRAVYKDDPEGRRPPFVLQGDALGTVRFWHGAHRTQWARDWVKLWTDGAGTFTMTDCEDQGILDVLDAHAASGKIDRKRVLVLRTGSNYSRAPDGQTSLPHVFSEDAVKAGFDATFRVGGVVARELVTHWDRYAAATPTGGSR
ncbi:purine nucleoside permease [Caulobacter soli]|uniref:purine nucleoside permease n=1 Tax=Caulobacter soli TaxID=2708539 RepID=UPI0013ECB6E8|nr:purine nucleoside permease [Caulobacter soli]